MAAPEKTDVKRAIKAINPRMAAPWKSASSSLVDKRHALGWRFQGAGINSPSCGARASLTKAKGGVAIATTPFSCLYLSLAAAQHVIHQPLEVLIEFWTVGDPRLVADMVRGDADHHILARAYGRTKIADPCAAARTAGVLRIAVLEHDETWPGFRSRERAAIHLNHFSVQNIGRISDLHRGRIIRRIIVEVPAEIARLRRLLGEAHRVIVMPVCLVVVRCMHPFVPHAVAFRRHFLGGLSALILQREY